MAWKKSGTEYTDPKERITQNLLRIMEETGEVPWQRPWQKLVPRNVNGRAYRGINHIILCCTEFADNRYLTFKQAQSLGGHVKKGEHGYYVIGWRWKSISKTIVVDDEEKQITSEIPQAFGHIVFNVEQCEGLNISPFIASPLDFVPQEKAQSIIDLWEDKPEIETRGNQAAYSPSFDEIRMPHATVFDSIDAYYATLFHELVHSTGHHTRLHRFKADEYENRHRSYGIEELVAEIGAAMLCSEVGIDNSAIYQNSASYLTNWMNAIGEDKSMIVYAASRAQKAVDMIMGTALEGEQEQPIAA